MYCPNCGVEIHTEGSFCAKCRKNVAYLTKPEDKDAVAFEHTENTESLPDNNIDPDQNPAQMEQTEPLVQPPTKKAEKLPEKGYYCNYCGTFVYPEDYYCYDCGKKTKQAYYKTETSHKNLYIVFAIIAVIIIAIISAQFLF